VIPLSLDEVARICPGDLHVAAWAEEVTGVQIDSRRIAEGDLFVAVGGGRDFTRHAVARGAAATLVPDNAFAALGALGRAVRERSRARVAGITGSIGKTSTKDILAALLAPHFRVVAAEASYNGELGVPLTLCRLEPDTEVCVLELAMRGFGQIAYLCELARPHVGVITNVAPVHLEFVGSLAGVARAKAELVDALPEGGTAVVPADEPLLAPFLEGDGVRVSTFGAGGDVAVVRRETAGDGASTFLALEVFGTRVELTVPFGAAYQTANTLAAVAAFAALGGPLARVGDGAGRIRFGRWRGEEAPLDGGGLLINDSYNANPVSMRAALEHQAQRAGPRRRVAVLGEMKELGGESDRYHRDIGSLARELGVEAIVAVGGEPARLYLNGDGHWAPDAAAAARAARELVRPGDCVLVKGSRAVGLEIVAAALADPAGAAR
jgi:UDP-N-acetylmuramoyl-tripeptide--D-alanyl-D-alanine ligase